MILYNYTTIIQWQQAFYSLKIIPKILCRCYAEICKLVFISPVEIWTHRMQTKYINIYYTLLFTNLWSVGQFSSPFVVQWERCLVLPGPLRLENKKSWVYSSMQYMKDEMWRGHNIGGSGWGICCSCLSFKTKLCFSPYSLTYLCKVQNEIYEVLGLNILQMSY